MIVAPLSIQWSPILRKAWRLILEDMSGYVTGRPLVGISDTMNDPWAYPTDWRRTLERADYYFGPFDRVGTPLWRVGEDLHYNPSRIAGYALAHWNVREEWTEGEGRRDFLACADWFAVQNDARFEYRFDGAGLKAPWLSCIAQGQGISVLVRAWILTGLDAYLDQASLATKWLIRPVSDGGLLDRLPDGSWFFEEYPGSYPHVLNGCLHAIVGLEDLARVRRLDIAASEAVSEVRGALVANLKAWDINGWSTYDMAPDARSANLNTVNYHAAHVALLAHVAGGDPTLALQAETWRKAMSNPGSRLFAMLRKIRYRLAESW